MRSRTGANLTVLKNPKPLKRRYTVRYASNGRKRPEYWVWDRCNLEFVAGFSDRKGARSWIQGYTSPRQRRWLLQLVD